MVQAVVAFIYGSIYYTALYFFSTDLQTFLTGLASKNEVEFHLFTRNDPNTGTALTMENAALLKGADKIVFIIHGWKETYHTYWYSNLTQAYLQRSDTNYHVIQVGWTIPANIIYLLSKAKSQPVGEVIAEFIVDAAKKLNLELNQFEIAGHSLGGHVAGFAGKKVIELTGRKIGRIIALDPAGPFFPLGGDPKRQLTKDDADVVVALHTCDGLLGHKEPCGTVDVYFNGGNFPQPGCPDDLEHTFIIFCSHHRSFRYFTEALYTGKFYATQCDSYREFKRGRCNSNKKINLGGTITERDRGIFHTITNRKPNYAIND